LPRLLAIGKVNSMIIKTFLDKANGVEVSVIMRKHSQYNVVTYDIDAMHYLDGTMSFLDRQQAINYAKRTANADAEMVASW
jgi:superfamily II helicase